MFGRSAFFRARIIALAALLVLLNAGCDDGATGSATPAPPANQVMRRVRDAVSETAGYRIVVEGHNFVLPQWGGVDGGEVAVRLEDGAARATLTRTGDGQYEMVRYGDQTYVQRSTCAYWQRVPGGGANVLAPFVLSDSGVLSATVVSVSTQTPDVLTIGGEFPDIGVATLEVDATSYLPRTLTKSRDDSGSETAWTFDMWDVAPDITSSADSPPDQGPGGNPC